jgi:hypothetical protein
MPKKYKEKSMRIAVIGAGSAGIITVAQLCANVPTGFSIVNIYDPNTSILGIGESTNSGFITVLEKACHFSFMEDMDEMDSTLKFGNKFMGWREHDWFNPLLDGGIAIHINNFKLREFVHKRCRQYWSNKFSTVKGKVESLTDTGHGVDVIVNGIVEHFDYVVDTRGFPTEWEDYHTVTSLPINRAIIHTEYKPGDWQYTEHRATANGWMFGIPLKHRRTYGYLFNDTITPVEEAYADVARIFNIDQDNIGRVEGQIEYQFKSYYSTKVLDGRIFKNGNRAIFFEPISASSIYFYVYANYLFLDHLRGIANQQQVNEVFVDYAQQLESMICFFYHGGSTFDTPFWHMAKERCTDRLMHSKHFKSALVDAFNMHQAGLPHEARNWLFSGYHLHLIDEKFGYNYFTNFEKNKKTIEQINANLNIGQRMVL